MTKKRTPAPSDARGGVPVFDLGISPRAADTTGTSGRGSKTQGTTGTHRAGDSGTGIESAWSLGGAQPVALATASASRAVSSHAGDPVPVFDLGGSPEVRASRAANNEDLRRFDLGQDETRRQEEFVRKQVLAAEQMTAAQGMTMEVEAAQQAWTLGEHSQQAQATLQEQVGQQALAQQTEQTHAAFRHAVEEQLMRTAQEQARGGTDGGGSLLHPSEDRTREEAAGATQSYSTNVHFQAGMTSSMNAVFHNMGH